MKNSIRLSKMTDCDLPVVTEIYNYYIQYSTAIFYTHLLTQAEIRQFVPLENPRYPSFMIKYGEKICGFCFVARFKPKEAFDVSVELTIYLYPDCVGKGIGYNALVLFEEKIRDAGFSNVIGLISGENLSSIRLFEKCGYECCGYIRKVARKFDRDLDLKIYQKYWPSRPDMK